MNKIKCMICGADCKRVLVETESLRTNVKFDYEICEKCSHISINSPLSDSAIGQSYLKKNILPDSTPNNLSLKRAKEVIHLHKEHNSKLNIYEIGSGNCRASHSFRHLGHRGIAVDVERFNPSYRDFVKFEDFETEMNKTSPNIFYSNHVFEHVELEDLKIIFLKIAPHVKDGASCYFVLPLAKLEMLKRGINLDEFVNGHKNLFTQASMTAFIKSLELFDKDIIIRCINIKHRTIFLKSRVAFAFKLFRLGEYKKTIYLVYFNIKTIFFGAPEELLILIAKK